MKEGINVIVRCPECQRRLMDKVTATNGVIEIKCPQCRKVVKVNLSLRVNNRSALRYRLAV